MSNELLRDKKVAIIGGGPVGLTLAVLLQRRGADVQVFERSSGPEVRISGSTLDIHADSGQLALEAAGLLPQFQRLARPTGERMADHHGAVLREEAADEANPYDRPEIDRADLQRLLLSALRPETLVWGRNFQSLEARRDGRFCLHFAECPDDFVADVVVGASGGRSKVRPYVSAQVPLYTGSLGIQGEIAAPATRCPEFFALVNGGNLMVRAEGKALFAHTKSSGELDYYLSFRQSADWFAQRGLTPRSPRQVAQFLAQELSTWAPLFHHAFRATTEFTFLQMHRVAPLPNRAVTQPITLVGDAAHLMPPFAGVGVNIGLLDALLLADNLSSSGRFGSVEAAIQAYEEAMYPYAHRAQEDTAVSELAIHSDMTFDELVAATRPPG